MSCFSVKAEGKRTIRYVSDPFSMACRHNLSPDLRFILMLFKLFNLLRLFCIRSSCIIKRLLKSSVTMPDVQHGGHLITSSIMPSIKSWVCIQWWIQDFPEGETTAKANIDVLFLAFGFFLKTTFPGKHGKMRVHLEKSWNFAKNKNPGKII